MAQLLHFGPYVWISFGGGLPAGAQHSWSWGPNPGFLRSGLVATAHPEPEGIDTTTGVERRLTVSMIQSSSYRCRRPICPCLRSQRGYNAGPQVLALAYGS